MDTTHRVLIISLSVLGALVVAFLIWWFGVRDDSPQTEIISHFSDMEKEVDDAPRGYDRYYNEALNLELFYLEGWALKSRDFGAAQEIEQADLPLVATTFDLSYFEQNDARVILNVADELYCQQTGKLDTWTAYRGTENPQKISDSRCEKPEVRRINNNEVVMFSAQDEEVVTYSIFLPFELGGGLVFSDTTPIEIDATSVEVQNITDSTRTSVSEAVNMFTRENKKLLVIE